MLFLSFMKSFESQSGPVLESVTSPLKSLSSQTKAPLVRGSGLLRKIAEPVWNAEPDGYRIGVRLKGRAGS